MSDQSIKIRVCGPPALRDTLLSVADGGEVLPVGIREIIAEEYPDAPAIEVHYEPCGSVAAFRQDLEAAVGDQADERRADVLALSIETDLRQSQGEWGSRESDSFRDELSALVRLAKQKLESHVIVVNASSVDPAEAISSYEGLDREPASLRAHRFNLATMRVSYEDAISIVDADRLVAELGAAKVLDGFLEYRPVAQKAICREFVRIVGDYGFLDSRPILPQVGRESSP